jgi:hypothetical protein
VQLLTASEQERRFMVILMVILFLAVTVRTLLRRTQRDHLPISRFVRTLVLSVVLLSVLTPSAVAQSSTPQFSREIRPILAAHCFTCHGADAKTRQADLRLDDADGSRKLLDSGFAAIVPGHAAQSELIRRIDSTDPDFMMPPPTTQNSLNRAQKELLRQWVDTGGDYQEHWAFQTPRLPEIPVVSHSEWLRNSIDAFVLSSLEAKGIQPSPEAEPAALLRRVSLDLLGLPPAIDELEQFLADSSSQAYENAVDRILQSPHLGEKLAQDWLDLARFGDTSGYQDDNDRPNYPYRDAVIQAFNENRPFDQFTIESLAGDLLPNATLEQKVLSGFNRLHRYNEEGGSDPEEFRVVYAVDRTNTTAATWMGLTFGCAQCHDHKYDPISQREYYQLLAFFNSLKGEITVSKGPANPPQIRVPGDAQVQQIAALQQQISETETKLSQQPAESQAELTARLQSLRSELEKLESSLPLALVWEEMDSPRPAQILVRGDYQQPGETVSRNVPAVFPPLPDSSPPTRLDLARWLVSGTHPLTSRVVVNRYWKQVFGAGLVRTADDFGVRGELPTHPELLDWLAIQFQTSGPHRVAWDIKALLRLMVTSATYRQSSRGSRELYERDPQDQLLARSQRFRLSAEEIRDMALTSSGLLTRTIGGRSVFPYQPDHFYRDKEDDPNEWKWPVETGPELYRRGLYTFIRRTSPYPTFQTFDVSGRGECTVTRARTNTPLQALVTLNDPVFFEAARVLAERTLAAPLQSSAERLRFLFRCVLTRAPESAEELVLAELLESETVRFSSDPDAAVRVRSQGSAPQNAALNPIEVAAWTVVSNAVLNLDESITRE